MEIDLRELKAVVDKLLDHIIETRAVNKVEVSQPNYWNVPSNQIYDPSYTLEKLDIDIGSLIDDWEVVRSVLDHETIPVAYQLTEVAPLLRYVGEKLGKELAKHGG